ncbi:MAG: response regulator [Deltaproteobacteria bacterium]|nr:MAG: response regulator [Deltaproteobacteria bacterium]
MENRPDVILIVDDNEMNRDMLSRRLNRKGYTCLTASDGEEALAMLAEDDRIDLVLLDIMMPKMNGIEVLQVVRQTRTMLDLPVIMVSAKIQSADIVKALELEANDYVTKPIDFPVALARIRTQLSRKHAEEALQRSESRNRAMVQAIPDALLLLERDGRLLDGRNTASLDWNITQDETGAASWTEELPDALRAQWEKAMQLTLEQKSMQCMEFQAPQSGENVDFEARLVPCGEEQVLMLLRDISERKALQRLRHEFMLLLQLDLQDSLGSIRSVLRMITQHPNLSIPGELKALLSIAQNKSNSLFCLIDDLINIHRMESGAAELKWENVDAVEVVRDVMEGLNEQGPGSRFRLLGDAGAVLPSLQTDRMLLEQVILHLLQNALSYSPKNEVVDVYLERRGDILRLSITDRGPQIPSAFRNRVFHKFGLSQRSAEGSSSTSLNLSLSKAIVETLGGHIGIEPGVPSGNTFYVELPFSPSVSSPLSPLGTQAAS